MEPVRQLSLLDPESTSSSEGSHNYVSRSASPASKKARKTSATSGLISHASSKRSDPVGYWLRTYLAFELSRLTSSSKTWKNSGTPHGRSWWVLTTLERPTEGSGSGSWPTPHGMQCDNERMAGPTRNELGRAVTKALWPTALWASPQSRDWKDSGPTQGNRKSPNLGTQAHTAGLLDQESRSTIGKRPDWPTPRSNRHGAPDSHGKSPIRGALNTAWVTQLMGFPDGWLDTPPPIAEKR